MPFRLSPPASTRLFLFALALGGCGGGEVHEPPQLGAACGPDTVCAGGLSCLPTSDGRGYCTAVCDASTPCPSGAVCNDAFGASVCFAACTADGDCPEGRQCWSGACQPACDADGQCGLGTCTGGRCIGPECTVPGDCGGGRVCTGGHCVEPVDGGGPMLAPGSPCTSAGECASGICLPADRGGVCSVPCTSVDACLALRFDSLCGPASIGGVVGTYCMPYSATAHGNAEACASDSQCSSSACVGGQCREVCDSDARCLRGQHCTSVPWGGGTFMGCGYDPAPASGTEVRTIDVGDYMIPANSGITDLVFATPPETQSVTLRARQTGGTPLELTWYEVYDAAERIFSLEGMSTYQPQRVRWYPFDSTSASAMLIPNSTTDVYTYRPGRLRFSLAAYPEMEGGTGTVNVHVDALLVVGAPPTAGTLHLRLHFVNVGVTAATAASDVRVQTMLQTYGSILAQVGITIADVSYVDVNAPALAVIDSADGEASELSQLFRTSTGTTENVLNLFLVQQVRAGSSREFNTLGISGGIPGPPRIHGSSHSGVVIAFDPGVVGTGAAGGRMAAQIAAHESGHFLGLFHNTEMARPCGAGETPTASNPCAPFGGGDTIADTSYGDSNNLMYFQVNGTATNTRLTAGQGFVELRNPLTR
ncbi:MAG: hypothetical protein U0234_09600 [Sandaracinus sp.]